MKTLEGMQLLELYTEEALKFTYSAANEVEYFERER